ncbi:hypothetical protein TWF730_000666 [Orbilia blumenaviensis]|uniref:GDP/GTP exchange factor Sec2 N-terminal domain-containing protein n=1 Tax=Orbilia blumenaviensis TaxID=1796055 RepID=A0AAV9VML9_9PEZI
MSTNTTTTSAATTADDTCRCKNCGTPFSVLSEADYPREARLRIEELEQQVKEFSVRAVMAAERLAQAQKEVHDLRRKSESGASTTSSIASINTTASNLPNNSQNAPLSPLKRSNTVTMTLQNMSKVGTQKINQLFYRSALPPATELPPPIERPPTPPEPLSRASMDSQALDNLSNALCSERRKRENAEKQLLEVKNEIEELSASLFQQANDMVADERKAKAKLEERVKVLEKRDADKRARLEMLEKGMNRIIRLRGVLGTTTPAPVGA